MTSRRPLLLLTVLIALLGLAAPAAQAKPALGFADQKPSIFDDVRLADLKVKRARVNVPWDVFQDVNTKPQFDLWMAGAKRNGITPLLTMNRSRRPGQASKNPTSTQVKRFVRDLRAAYPGQVKELSAWNEGNLNKKATLVVKWYKAMRSACSSCTVLGADIVDTDNAVRWSQQWIKANKGRAPKYWGLHNYVDTNNYTSKRTLDFAKRVRGGIWLTETGGVLSRKAGKARFKGTGNKHAAKATRYLLDTMLKNKRLKKITRVYLYSWSTSSDDITWDSGMIGPKGEERSMLAVVRRYLGRKRISRPQVPPPASGGTVVPQE